MKWSISILFAAAALVGCLATAINVGPTQVLLVPFNDLLPPLDVEVETTTAMTSKVKESTTKTKTLKTTTTVAPVVLPELSLEPLLPPVEAAVEDEQPTVTTPEAITTSISKETFAIAATKSPFTVGSAIEVAASKNVAETTTETVRTELKTQETKPTKKSYYQQQQKQQKVQQLFNKQLQQVGQYQRYQPPAFVTRPPKGALPTLTPFPRHLKRFSA